MARSNDSSSDLSTEADFVEAWRLVEAAKEAATNTRARSFAVWVGLFQFLDDDDTVTMNAEEIADTFSITRVTWQSYRELLSEVGLIVVEKADSADTRRRMRLRLSPPLLSAE